MYSTWKKWTSLALAAALSIGAPSYAHADDLTSSSSVSSSDSSASPASEETDAKTQTSAATDSDTVVSSGSAAEGVSADSISNQAKDSHTETKTDSSSSSEASEEDQETVVSSDSTSTEIVSADSSSDTGNSEEDKNSIDFSNLDFSSMRLVIGTSDASLVSDDKAVVGSCDNVYLAQYDSEEETEKAYKQYYGKVDFVEPDTGLGAAEDSTESTANTMTEEPMTEDSNPMQELSAADNSSDAAAVSADVVALIDTGSSSYTSGSVSMLGDDGVDRNGHGTEMAKLITEEAEDPSILSIKALNDAGDGTVSSVYAAMEYAISKNVKAINLSLSGYAMNDSAAIDQAIHDAISAGIVVVGAAGNNGREASYFVPGRCTDAYIIGSCDENGKRLSSSNYGDTVDYFVTSGSTSEAAAKFTGKLVKAGFVVNDAVKAGGVFTGDGESLSTAEEKTEEKADEDTDKETKLSAAADTITVTLNANGGTFSDGTTTKQVQCTKESSWRGYTYSFNRKNFPYPTKSGMACYGWNTTANATYEMYDWVGLTDGETIYALYTESSGTWGSCPWSFDTTTNILTIGAGTGEREGWHIGGSDVQWYKFQSRIVKVNVTGTVVLPSDSSYLFDDYPSVISINAEKFDTSQVTNMSGMFADCPQLATLDASHFNTSLVTDMSRMFYYCPQLATLDVSHFNTSLVTNMSQMFNECSQLTALDVSNFDTSKVTDMSYMFCQCYQLAALDVSHFNTSQVTNMSGMFAFCNKLNALDVSHFNTSLVTDMSSMFSYCSQLATLDVSHFNTSLVTNMSQMFNECSQLTALAISMFDTSNVTNMHQMFDSCSKLTALDVSQFHTSKVTDMTQMFIGCSKLTTLDVSHFNTSLVTNMNGMFEGCSQLTALDVSNFDTSNVTNMTYMFALCSQLTALDVSNFDTSKVTDMSWMFDDADNLKSLDLSSFDTSKVTNMSLMLIAASLNKITLGSNFVIPSTNNNSCFPSLIEKTYSGQPTNNKWGLGSENAATQYSADDIIRLGQTKGKLTGTWYAQAARKYTLTYNGNGGTPSATSKTGYEMQTWDTLATATRSGYTFRGWYTAASGGTQVTSNTFCTSDLIVYAHWSANTYTNSISHWTWGYTNKEGNNGDAKNAFKIGDTTFNEACGAKYTLTASNGVKIPNGYYLANGFGTSSISNSWGNYTFGTTITQNAGGMSFEYDYYPTSYSITYQLNGGTNNSTNPSSYNVLYGVTFAAPMRSGYTFAGWTIDGKTVTGINPGVNATFSSPNDLYTKLAARTTGNKTVVANWKANINTKYIVYHQQEQLDGSYKTVNTDSLTGTTDTTVKPTVKTYTGFTSPAQQSLTIKGDGTASITYKYTRNSYTVKRQYRLENADGTFSAYTTIDSKKYKYGASVAVWNRAADTTYQAASIAAYTVPAKDSTLSVDVKRLTSTNNKIQYRLQNANGSYPSTYTVGWSGTLRAGESHTWSYSQTASHKAISKTVSYNGGIVNVDVSRRTGRLVIKANGGTGDRTSTDIIYGSTYDYIYPLPTRTGYTLTGLYTAASGGTKVADADGKPSNDGTYSKDNAWKLTSDVTVYAQWTINNYSISYNLNGGVVSGNPATYNITNNAITLKNPTKKGYTFTGWTGSNGTTKQTSVTITKGSTGNKSYTANWTANTLTVTVNINGGTAYSNGSPNPIVYSYDGTIDKTYGLYDSSNYTSGRTGYTMTGLYHVGSANSTLTVKENGQFLGDTVQAFATAIGYPIETKSQSVTLYTDWKANAYTIAFNDNNGSGTMANESMTYDTAKALPVNTFTRKGYTFTGWNTKADGSGTSYANGASVKNLAESGTVTLYAQWKANTTRLHLDPEGGENHTDGATIEGNPDYLNLLYDWSAYYVQALPTKTGYTFEGYYTEKNGTGSKVYGSGIDPDYHPNDATIYMIATPGTGYWKLTKTTECIWQYAGSTLTVYAHWLPNSYTVAFDGNGSTGGTMANESMTYDTAKTLTANAFTRKGYTFTGWNTKADGSGTSYVDKASVKNLVESGTVTLYAQWTANTYTVTIPTAIIYSNMPTGNVNVTNTYDISVDCKTGSFGDTIEVASTPSPMVSKSGKSSSLEVSSGSSKLPLSFTAAGTKQDQATITGTANTADVWTGAIQYTVTKK